MQVVILGSGTAVPSLERGSPGLLVRTDQDTILFDGGSGTIRSLLKAGVRLTDIDYIFYTHLHPDHTADLVPMLFALRNPDLARAKELRIAGPPGFGAFFAGLQRLYGPWVEPANFRVTIEEVGEGERSYPHFRLLTREVKHIPDSLGYRLQSDGKMVAFSGDSDYCQGLIDLGRGADLFVLECSFPDEGRVAGHLTPTLAGEVASKAGCRRLILTHFYPACEGHDLLGPCKKLYSGEVNLAYDLMSVSW